MSHLWVESTTKFNIDNPPYRTNLMSFPCPFDRGGGRRDQVYRGAEWITSRETSILRPLWAGGSMSKAYTACRACARAGRPYLGWTTWTCFILMIPPICSYSIEHFGHCWVLMQSIGITYYGSWERDLVPASSKPSLASRSSPLNKVLSITLFCWSMVNQIDIFNQTDVLYQKVGFIL